MTTYRDRHHAGIHANPNAADEATLAELKTQAKALGLAVSGNKSELQKRIDKARATT